VHGHAGGTDRRRGLNNAASKGKSAQ